MTEVEQRDTVYMIHMTEGGGHIHVRMFSMYVGNCTWACIGSLCIAKDEELSFVKSFTDAGVQIKYSVLNETQRDEVR